MRARQLRQIRSLCENLPASCALYRKRWVVEPWSARVYSSLTVPQSGAGFLFVQAKDRHMRDFRDAKAMAQTLRATTTL
jgi:hypothetical protein